MRDWRNETLYARADMRARVVAAFKERSEDVERVELCGRVAFNSVPMSHGERYHVYDRLTTGWEGTAS